MTSSMHSIPEHYTFGDGRQMRIGTMYCIGRNYARHAREMGVALPEFPVVFLKPPAAYVADGGIVRIPSFSNTLHHELELVVVVGSYVAGISPAEARACIAGYAVGLDMTLRDVQQRAKNKGEPWASAKGFVSSAPISTVLPAESVGERDSFGLSLWVNGELRQQGSTASMERTPEELLAHLSSVFTLRPGDCIFTGTPDGVGPVRPGDMLRAELSGLCALDVSVAAD